jgi:hypothetical protein
MSLYALPVSVGDLTQLQLGIEFFSGTTEATTEAVLITNPTHTATVSSYANQLLANNISLSQVAIAVDSLMFGVTDNTNELAKLSTQFLPKQVAAAVGNGLNPTVYAAEALGLALAGGNGTSNAFATHFGSLSDAQFASEVASLTGINSAAIQGFVQNWINFYTAHPAAAGSLSVTLAAYGAAFGDAVGTALLNPTVNGTTALLVSAEQNALIDNAEGIYKAGLPLTSEAPHLGLQGGAFLIPDAGGAPFGPTIDWAQSGAGNYAQFVAPAQSGSLTIKNAPGTFTLDTQHFATSSLEIDAGGNNGGNGDLCTLIVGDSTAGEKFGSLTVEGYSTVNIVTNGGDSSLNPYIDLNFHSRQPAHLVVSGSGTQFLALGTSSQPFGFVETNGGTITDLGQQLYLGDTDAATIDASNAPLLAMLSRALIEAAGQTGITVLGGTSNNQLQGSFGAFPSYHVGVFGNGTYYAYYDIVGADNITGGPGGNDLILGGGGPDTITLPPNHLLPDSIGFGYDLLPFGRENLIITDGADEAYPGSWGASAPTAIPSLFSGSTGGTSADMATITGFHAGSGGDQLIFDTAAWNGASTTNTGISTHHGDLVDLDPDLVVVAGAAQLSPVWVNNTSNISLESGDNVLRYAPAGGSPHNAQQLAAQLQGASGAIALPAGFIQPGQDVHILVAYDANSRGLPVVEGASTAAFIVSPLPGVTPLQGPPAVNIADVDLVNTSSSPQNSTFGLNVYASDMVHLTGVSLANLTSANFHFI